MSKLAKKIVKWGKKAFSNPWGFLRDEFLGNLTGVFGSMFEEFRDSVIQPVMGFFGFTDETVVVCSVSDVRVFDGTLLKKAKIKNVMNKVKRNWDGKTYVLQYAAYGAAQFFDYFKRGRKRFIDYLPEVQLLNNKMDSESIKKAIARKEELHLIKNTIKISLINYGVPTDQQWADNYLFSLGYNLQTNILMYNGIPYEFQRVAYNSVTNSYTIYVKTSGIRVDTITRTVVDITPRYIEVLEGEEIKIIEDPDNLNKQTLIYKQIKRYIDKTNELISDTGMELIFNETVLIPKDSEEKNSDNTVTESEVIDDGSSMTFSVPPKSGNYVYTIYYTFVSKQTDELTDNIWIYDPTTNEYPEIKGSTRVTPSFDVFPVVTVRSGFFDISEYDKETKKVGDETVYRPSIITKERFRSSDKTLAILGIDTETLIEGYTRSKNPDTDEMEDNPDIERLQDAFVQIGVTAAIKDNKPEPVISKVLFLMFEYIYKTSYLPPEPGETIYDPDVQYYDALEGEPDGNLYWVKKEHRRAPDEIFLTDEAYSAAFKENPYNAMMTWMPTDALYQVKEISGNLGIPAGKRFKSYTHEFVNYKVISFEDGEPISVKVDTGMGDAGDDYEWFTPRLMKRAKTMTALVLKHQKTPNTIEVITLLDPRIGNIIKHDDVSTGVTKHLSDENAIIPLPCDIVFENFTMMEKISLLDASVHLTFYAAEESFVKWYKTKAFMNFVSGSIMFAMIVIMIVCMFVPGLQFLALGMGTLTNLLLQLLIGAILIIVLKIVLKLVDDPMVKAILAGVAVAVSIVVGGMAGGFNMMTVVQLLAVPAVIMEVYTGAKKELLQKEMGEFSSKYEERSKDINEAREQMFSGLNSGDLTNIILPDEIDIHASSSFSPSLLMELQTTAFLNTDLLFRNPVTDFIPNMMKIGVQET